MGVFLNSLQAELQSELVVQFADARNLDTPGIRPWIVGQDASFDVQIWNRSAVAFNNIQGEVVSAGSVAFDPTPFSVDRIEPGGLVTVVNNLQCQVVRDLIPIPPFIARDTDPVAVVHLSADADLTSVPISDGGVFTHTILG